MDLVYGEKTTWDISGPSDDCPESGPLLPTCSITINHIFISVPFRGCVSKKIVSS